METSSLWSTGVTRLNWFSLSASVLSVRISSRYDTAVNPGDVVNIVGEFDANGVCRITDQSNYIVVNPDRLLSGTSIVSSVHCMRRYQLLCAFQSVISRLTIMELT